MAALATAYWVATTLVVYPYLIYPALLAVRARFRPRPIRRRPLDASFRPTVSVVITAYNEAEAAARRVREFRRAIEAEGLMGEVIVVSDGSTDGTAAAARAAGAEPGAVPLTVVDLPANGGKAIALNAGFAAATREVVFVADTRQVWAQDALSRMLENFGDPEVGAVCGELVIESAPGVMAGVGLYWTFEKWMRRNEGLVHSMVGVTGAIAAVRRSLFRPIPAGCVLDDVDWPLGVAQQGYRVVFDGRARAMDRLPEVIRAEFRRKVRTLSGNFQLVQSRPELLFPWKNPVWFALLSHKLARLTVPWALLVTLAASATIGGPVYGGLFVLQASGMLVGLAGLWPPLARRSKLASAAGSFLVLNAAAFVGFWVWATGRTSSAWTRTQYAAPVAGLEAAS